MKKNILVLCILIIFIIGGTYYLLRTGSINPADFDIELNIEPLKKPSPEVTQKRLDDEKSKLLNGIATIYTSIKNNGGSGYINIEATLTQKGRTYTRFETRFIPKQETIRREYDFSEFSRFKGEVRYNVLVNPSRKPITTSEVSRLEKAFYR